mmetsp:Transcript_6839/g.29657  ORF Transcript_6839/g.29657 Transcript_6839/m.29657 type:complete len:221 (+) Transcript_6839:3328-3990(+)
MPVILFHMFILYTIHFIVLKLILFQHVISVEHYKRIWFLPRPRVIIPGYFDCTQPRPSYLSNPSLIHILVVFKYSHHKVAYVQVVVQVEREVINAHVFNRIFESHSKWLIPNNCCDSIRLVCALHDTADGLRLLVRLLVRSPHKMSREKVMSSELRKRKDPDGRHALRLGSVLPEQVDGSSSGHDFNNIQRTSLANNSLSRFDSTLIVRLDPSVCTQKSS